MFAFEPADGAPVTDMAFKSAIDAVSANSTVRFLADHLYFEVARRMRRRKLNRWLYLTIFGPAALLAVLWASALVRAWGAKGGAGFAWLWVVTAILVALGVALTAYAIVTSRTLAFSREAFAPLLERWKAVHGAPRMLIVRRPPEAARKHPEHADLENYSFDRAVVCDRGETVDVLLANNFHFENNCAVLSVDGYPQRAFATVLAMLRKNPKLSVYVLHDATIRGCTLAHELANHPKWFKGTARVVEVGIRPVHAAKFLGLWREETTVVVPGRGVTPTDAAWLHRYSMELAVIRPEQVIKRLFRAMISTTATETEDEYWIDELFSGDASSSDGGDDSFG